MLDRFIQLSVSQRVGEVRQGLGGDADKNFKQALGEFRRVIDDYPDGNKVPDSLLKIALSYQSLGDGPTARYVLAQVVEIFPDSSAARVARERLERL